MVHGYLTQHEKHVKKSCERKVLDATDLPNKYLSFTNSKVNTGSLGKDCVIISKNSTLRIISLGRIRKITSQHQHAHGSKGSPAHRLV